MGGQSHPGAKLSVSDAESIRRRYARDGVTQVELAAEYGVTQAVISSVVRRRSYKCT